MEFVNQQYREALVHLRTILDNNANEDENKTKELAVHVEGVLQRGLTAVKKVDKVNDF
jgi:hypothetical protein